MESVDARRPRPVRRIVSLLIDTGPVGDPSWRFRLTTALALAGPGSVPFGFLLFGVQNQILRENYGVEMSILVAFLTGVGVIGARFHPLPAWLAAMATVGWVAAAAKGFGDEPWPLTVPSLFALLVAQFAVARECRVPIAIGTWAVYLLVGAWIARQVGSDLAYQNLTLGGLLTAAALVVGMSVRMSRGVRRRVEEEERLTAEERTRRRMLEERTRIARELHDVVAHHMSVIAVQASTAEYRLDELDETARAEFRSISEQARESLGEMRRLLAVLRSEDEAALRAPQPGLDRLEALVEAVDRSGTPATLTVGQLPEHLPEAVSVTAYRVVQEALSNVVRHAAGAPTAVTVSGDAHGVVVEVVNAAPQRGSDSPELHGAGLGLAGMRERVTLLNGQLDAEPTEDGGFAVRAHLPVDAGFETQEGTP
ncbi:MAG: sensor histidine kinase [Stackebrandtia sp.]